MIGRLVEFLWVFYFLTCAIAISQGEIRFWDFFPLIAGVRSGPVMSDDAST
jgi:hypothetical protein